MGKGSETRLRVISAAAASLNRGGWLATPVSEVLAAANLTKGGLYNHFGSQRELTDTAFDFAAGRLIALVQSRLAGPGPAQERLTRLLDAFDRIGTRLPPFEAGCPILNAATEADDQDEAMRERVASAALHLIGLLAECIAEGVRAGEFRPGLDPVRAARLLFATFEGGVMLAGLTRDGAAFADLKADMLDLVAGWTA